MNGIYLLLGTNLGDRRDNLLRAAELLNSQGCTIVDNSSIYESAPWGDPDQPWFLNMVVRLKTIHGPEDLLKVCLSTEQQMGRKRLKKWGQRLIDIDILYYENYVIETEMLTIPHPEIALRMFTLMPLVELAPHEEHQLLSKTQSQLLNICTDSLECKKTDLTFPI